MFPGTGAVLELLLNGRYEQGEVVALRQHSPGAPWEIHNEAVVVLPASDGRAETTASVMLRDCGYMPISSRW